MTTKNGKPQSEQDFSPKSPKELLLETIIATKDEDLLHGWIKFYFGVDIPRVAVCHDHCAPFDFVRDYIFGLHDFFVVLANRSGGKTLNFGILDTTMAYAQDNTEIATVGAIQFQAQKGYEYFSRFSSNMPFVDNVERMTISKTTHKNKSIVQILTGTMTGVNSPHPQLVFLDEIDLMVWQVLQQALSMAQSKQGVRARTVLTSTRKFANGPMQRLINDAKEMKAAVYQWCIWDVIEPLPHHDKEKMKKIQDTFGASLPANIDRANGYYFWDDAITKYNTLDKETWAVEWLCARPGLKGVIYGASYSDDENLLVDWTPAKSNQRGYIYIAEDFGHGEGHPDVVLFCWIPITFDRIVVFDELYVDHQNTGDIWRMIDEKLWEYGHNLPDIHKGKKGTIEGWVPDPHGLTEIADRQASGAPILNKQENGKLLIINNGIPLVRKLFESGRLMITDKCVNLRLELFSYKKKLNADGTYSDTPEKKNDHGPDALRYFIIQVYDLIAEKAFMPHAEEKPREDVPKLSERRPWVPQVIQPTPGLTITGGMSGGKSWR